MNQYFPRFIFMFFSICLFIFIIFYNAFYYKNGTKSHTILRVYLYTCACCNFFDILNSQVVRYIHGRLFSRIYGKTSSRKKKTTTTSYFVVIFILKNS